MYCQNCGKEIQKHADVCLNCGCAINADSTFTSPNKENPQNNEWLTAVLLCFFFGWVGVHRFYTKNNDTAIIQLILGISCCGCIVSGVWAIMDLISLLTGSFKTGDGRVLKSA